MGSCVVGLNVKHCHSLCTDQNPHLINFYSALQSRTITPNIVRNFLEKEGTQLAKIGSQHYYDIRNRFNLQGDPLDFLFLSRSCFNGLMRFNRKRQFNAAFCKETKRFNQTHIAKIVNQVTQSQETISKNHWEFICSDFEEIIATANANDLIYCDPPYLGRHVNYFESWSEKDENRLFHALSKTKARFILSTWHSDNHKENNTLKTLWNRFHVVTKEHFYRIGPKETNRFAVMEALVLNFTPDIIRPSNFDFFTKGNKENL
jgi:DNA adenine methylase